jgi:hypothetical protein
MPAKTTEKGEIGEAIVIAGLMRQEHDIAIPFGHNQPYDLIVIRKEDGSLEKVQVKYTTGDGKIVKVKVESTSAWVRHTYTPDEVDGIAVYDATVDRCFYIRSDVWGGQKGMNLRLVPTANGQKKFIRFADAYTRLTGPILASESHSVSDSELPFDTQPE